MERRTGPMFTLVMRASLVDLGNSVQRRVMSSGRKCAEGIQSNAGTLPTHF